MKKSKFNSRSMRYLLGLLTAIVCLNVVSVQAQVASQVLVGTVEVMAQDDGYLIISGTRYNYSNTTEVYLRGEPASTTILQQGLSVRFSLDANGNMIRIDILGPINMLRLLEQN